MCVSGAPVPPGVWPRELDRQLSCDLQIKVTFACGFFCMTDSELSGPVRLGTIVSVGSGGISSVWRRGCLGYGSSARAP